MMMTGLSGLLTGFLISAPLGPMAALASLEVSRKRWKAALAVAGGVCVGDMLLAMGALVLLRTPVELGIPLEVLHATAAFVLAVLGIVIWKDAGKPVQPAAARNFSKAVVVTVVHPGNIVAFIALYASVLRLLEGRMVGELNWGEGAVLLVATGGGMVLGWGLVLGSVHALVRRFGRIPERWQRRLAQGIALMVLASALMLVAGMGMEIAKP